MAGAAGESGVNIRTFDISVDQLTGVRSLPERNPSLGLRSIRLGLADPFHFRIQIRAILRAAVDQFVDILLPMVSNVEEIWQAKEIIDEEKERLRAAGIPFGDPQIGAMIEVPSAVMTAQTIARNVDFLCLGTNDLVQYLLAVDRDNEAIGNLYQSLHPSVIRAISEVIAAADRSQIPIMICGEMAGSAFYVPLLIGLGAREISMNVNSVAPIRRLISGITVSACKGLVESLVDRETADQNETLLRSFYLENWAELFPYGLLDSKHR
jgi:phosphotransferase system enzyme I (PtsI)